MKKFASLVCGAAFLVSSVGFAAVSPDKIALGRVVPGMSVNELIAACGQPNAKIGDDWYYDKFTVEVDDDRPNVVEQVSTRDSSLVTPLGVAVGQSASVLNSTFGAADDIESDGGVTEYEYYSTDRKKKIEFKVVDGVIRKISCKLRG